MSLNIVLIFLALGSATAQTPTPPSPLPARAPPPSDDGSDFQRTLIMVELFTQADGNTIFLRGGLDPARRSGCQSSPNLAQNPCAIPIIHLDLNLTSSTEARYEWAKGDNYLDWDGAEPNQGIYQGYIAQGTPLQWATNKPNDRYHTHFNTYGKNYWVADLEMDCSKTEQGFFEFHPQLDGYPEPSFGQFLPCSDPGSSKLPPFNSTYHVGRCGYLTVVHWGKPACEYYDLSVFTWYSPTSAPDTNITTISLNSTAFTSSAFTSTPANTAADVSSTFPSSNFTETIAYTATAAASVNSTSYSTILPTMTVPANTTSEATTTIATTPSTTSTTPSTTPSPYRRTVILVELQTREGQNLFIRGGIGHHHNDSCSKSTPLSMNPCAIPIRHHKLDMTTSIPAYDSWSVRDNYLDWYGAEPSQGRYGNTPADGTPAQWTTSNTRNKYYSMFNRYGDHYWLVDVDMDCSKTLESFFEFKARIDGKWEREGNFNKNNLCEGPETAPPPYNEGNHMARCGYVNVFHWNQERCEYHNFSEFVPTLSPVFG